MKEFIKADRALYEELQMKFNLTRRGVYTALHFFSRSRFSDAIRTHALRHGGKLVREEEIPHCGAEYSMAAVIMKFGYGVVVRLDSFSNCAVLMMNGECYETLEDCNIGSFASLCGRAQYLAGQRSINAMSHE